MKTFIAICILVVSIWALGAAFIVWMFFENSNPQTYLYTVIALTAWLFIFISVGDLITILMNK